MLSFGKLLYYPSILQKEDNMKKLKMLPITMLAVVFSHNVCANIENQISMVSERIRAGQELLQAVSDLEDLRGLSLQQRALVNELITRIMNNSDTGENAESPSGEFYTPDTIHSDETVSDGEE